MENSIIYQFCFVLNNGYVGLNCGLPICGTLVANNLADAKALAEEMARRSAVSVRDNLNRFRKHHNNVRALKGLLTSNPKVKDITVGDCTYAGLVVEPVKLFDSDSGLDEDLVGDINKFYAQTAYRSAFSQIVRALYEKRVNEAPLPEGVKVEGWHDYKGEDRMEHFLGELYKSKRLTNDDLLVILNFLRA